MAVDGKRGAEVGIPGKYRNESDLPANVGNGSGTVYGDRKCGAGVRIYPQVREHLGLTGKRRERLGERETGKSYGKWQNRSEIFAIGVGGGRLRSEPHASMLPAGELVGTAGAWRGSWGRLRRTRRSTGRPAGWPRGATTLRGRADREGRVSCTLRHDRRERVCARLVRRRPHVAF
jgi:hypothetical protein